MEKHADAKHAHVHNTDNQIIYKVSHGQGLNETTGTCISEDSLTGCHGAALLVGIHDPQGGGINDNALNKRDNMDIPVQLRPGSELVIRLRKEDW